MSDSYQATYDAVRSRISGCNVGEAIRDAVRSAFDISFVVPQVQQEISNACAEMQRPAVLFRPTLEREDDHYIATYGAVVGMGDTPAEAMANFDNRWKENVNP